MKKVSTGAAQQLSNFSRQNLTIGLDLGDRSSYYCVLDDSGGLLRQQRIATTAKGLQAAFGALPRSRIALETGVHSPWVSRLLSGLGHEVIVAHARNVRLIGESGRMRHKVPDPWLATARPHSSESQVAAAANNRILAEGESIPAPAGIRSGYGPVICTPATFDASAPLHSTLPGAPPDRHRPG